MTRSHTNRYTIKNMQLLLKTSLGIKHMCANLWVDAGGLWCATYASIGSRLGHRGTPSLSYPHTPTLRIPSAMNTPANFEDVEDRDGG